MSETENTQIEETSTSVEGSSQDNPAQAGATGNNSARNNGRGREGGRPPRGDKRGPRRDGMREEEKEFQEEMLSVDRVTRVTA